MNRRMMNYQIQLNWVENNFQQLNIHYTNIQQGFFLKRLFTLTENDFLWPFVLGLNDLSQVHRFHWRNRDYLRDGVSLIMNETKFLE